MGVWGPAEGRSGLGLGLFWGFGGRRSGGRGVAIGPGMPHAAGSWPCAAPPLSRKGGMRGRLACRACRAGRPAGPCLAARQGGRGPPCRRAGRSRRAGWAASSPLGGGCALRGDERPLALRSIGTGGGGGEGAVAARRCPLGCRQGQGATPAASRPPRPVHAYGPRCILPPPLSSSRRPACRQVECAPLRRRRRLSDWPGIMAAGSARSVGGRAPRRPPPGPVRPGCRAARGA